ncbi:hypothetical protein ERJ75_001009200 [Trypanosoma vivax]|nr:hypothetical protein ERJ75_001009200 [Trypanosoma vivax]
MGGDSLYIFYRNRFLYSSTTEYQYGVPGSCSARSTVCPLPTRDVIEALTSSIVRVNHHTTLGNTVASDSDSQRTVDDVRPWTAADCMACIKNTRLWGHLMSGSPQSLSVARGSGNMALHVGDVTVTAKGSNLPLDQDFARRFVSRCWWDVGLSESQTVNSVGASPYMDSVYDVVTQMCRLLPQCSDNVKAMGSEGAWSHFSGRHCEMAAHDSRGEAEHISAIVTGISKSDLEQYNALHSDVEPLMVGLVCREGRGQPPAYNAVRTLTTAERLAVVGNSEDLVVSIQGSFQESRSVSVLLLELELANGEPNCDAESSSMWKTLLSVVDFVHVTGKRSFITQLDILIAEVRGSLLHAAPQGGKSSEQNRTMPMQGYRRDPFCSFSDFARPQLFYTVVEAGAVSVRCSNRALSVEGLQAALLKLPEIGPAMRAPCCGRLGPLQWLLLAEDMWLSASCAEVGGVSATEHKVDFAVKAATCVFARVAEGLLLAMHTTKSHSQRPDDIGIRDCDSWPENNGNAALSDDSAAVSWLYTVSWALRVAHRAALCVLGVAAAPQIVWDHASAHYKLYMACENEAESVRERFHYYGVIPTVRSTKLMKMPASETKDSALQIERDEAFGCAAPTVHKNVCEKQRLSTVPSLSRCSVMHNSEDGGTESFGVFYPSDNKENPVVLPRTVEVTSSASSEFPHQRLPTRLPRSTGFLACTVAEENQSPAQLYDALLLMKKQCAQFHERCRRAEGELKRQQAVARESRRQRAVLGGRLREVSSCLQRLVMLCIEYEEAHEGYERRRVFRLNHSFPPHAADDTDAWCLGSSSSFTPRNELWSTVAPGDVSGPMIDGREDEIPLRLEASQKQLTRLMLRDTQRHLNVCRNIILSIYHEAHGALRKTNLSTADCSLSGGASADISSAYQCESELSTVIRSARSESSAKRGSRTTYAALNSAQSTLWSESAINKAISAFYRSQEADELAGVDYSEKTSAHHASAELSDSSETVGALYMEGNVSNVQARVQGEAEDKCSQTTQPMSDGLFSLLVPRLKQGVAFQTYLPVYNLSRRKFSAC